MQVDLNGYMSSWLKIGLLSLAVVAVVAVTIATFGATSLVGIMAITGAINTVAQTATVAIAQYQKTHNSSYNNNNNNKNLNLKTINDVGDAVADCYGKIIMRNFLRKLGSGTIFTAGEIIASSSTIGIDAVSNGVSRTSVWLKYGGQKATSNVAGTIALGFSLYHLGKTVIAFLDEEKAYEYAIEYGWNPR